MSSIKFRLRGSFLAVLAVGLVWIGCTDNRADLTSPADLGPNILVVDQVALSHAIRVQKAHTDEMFEIAGVVGTAVGLSESGRPVVKIFTREAGVDGLPESLEGVPVAVEVTGMIFALRALADPTLEFPRPVPIGVSTGHPDITAGTIGARVTDGANVFALSNNHVYANANAASIGDNALQPGPFDGGTDPADAIGTLFDFEPIEFAKRRKIPTNTMDAAIVLSSAAMLGTATPEGGYGTPSSTTASVSINQQVKKYGRTTKLTYGQVSAISVTVDVCYEGFVVCTSWARFEDQIAITDGTFSGGGDSGSLIVTQNGNNPVGLLFAGSSTHTIANRIDLVLDRFNVTIDDAAPAPAPTLSSISVTPASASIEEGQTQQFTATGNFDDGSTADLTSTATWASSNTGVATIDASGLATGVSAGTTNITASQDPVTSDAATLEVTAPPPPPTLSSISVTPASASIEDGQTQQFTATGNFDDGSTADLTSTATWASSNTGVATIDASGLATGVLAGTTDITASQDPVTSSAAALEVTPLAATDAVTITKAQYQTKAGRLRVEAESTDATAVLTAYDAADPNSLLGVLVDGKLNIRISPSPADVLVVSDKGGSATKPVEIK